MFSGDEMENCQLISIFVGLIFTYIVLTPIIGDKLKRIRLTQIEKKQK